MGIFWLLSDWLASTSRVFSASAEVRLREWESGLFLVVNPAAHLVDSGELIIFCHFQLTPSRPFTPAARNQINPSSGTRPLRHPIPRPPTDTITSGVPTYNQIIYRMCYL